MNTKRMFLKNIYSKILLLFLILVAAFFVAMCIGRYHITPFDVVKIIYAYFRNDVTKLDPICVNVVMQVRLPRILLSMIIGAGLACSGASYQCLFGNPLVSPDILGVSAGAGFGASLAIILSASSAIIQIQALLFGLLAVGIVLFISRVQKKTELYMLVLSGVIVGALFEASYQKVTIAAAAILPCMMILFVLRWKMNLLSLPEEEAKSLGVRVEQLRVIIIVVSTLMTAVSVSLCGIIGWIGLVIPHIARFFVGDDHRGLIPACMISGAVYLLLIDTMARTITAAEIPLSILTAIIGAPFFAVILRRTMGGKSS